MILPPSIPQPQPWLDYPGKGKHIVFLAGDEEYRSEESLPQLAKILSKRHGFHCTVLFSVDEQGFVNPNHQTNEPGLEALDHADLCVMLLRFRRWPDAQMKHFVDYYRSGKPIIAVRTSTHAFAFEPGTTYAKYTWNSTEWPGGFGKQVLGETWLSHWGNHGSQGTRAIPQTEHPILKGVKGIFGTTDVYEAHPPTDATILLRGEVVDGMKPTDPALPGPKNQPMMPIAWTRETPNRIVTCTMGAATDFLNPGLRQFFVNSVYWALKLKPKPVIDLVGEYRPSPFGFNKFLTGKTPSDFGRG